MLENNNTNSYRNYKVVIVYNNEEEVLASYCTKNEALTMISYMEEYDDLLGLPVSTYKVILNTSDVNTLNE